MRRRTFLSAALAALAAPSATLAGTRKRGGGFKTIPYEPLDCDPYYDPVTELRAKYVDARIWPAVKRINESGWVWTAESCQGHPKPLRNQLQANCPWLRLVCRQSDAATMLGVLAAATPKGAPQPGQKEGRVELRMHTTPPAGWFEVRVYVRKGGIGVFERFAEKINHL